MCRYRNQGHTEKVKRTVYTRKAWRITIIIIFEGL